MKRILGHKIAAPLAVILVATVVLSCMKKVEQKSQRAIVTEQEWEIPVDNGQTPGTSGGGVDPFVPPTPGVATVGVRNFNQYYKSLLGSCSVTESATIATAYSNFKSALPQSGFVANVSAGGRFSSFMIAAYVADGCITKELAAAQAARLVFTLVPVTAGNVSAGNVLSDAIIDDVVQKAALMLYRRDALPEEKLAGRTARADILANAANPTVVQNRFVLQVILNAMMASLDMVRI